MAYDHGNIFARIIRGEVPSVKVWEAEDSLCIMDAFPECSGHCLVMPKAPAITLLDLDVQPWQDLMAAVYTTAQAVSSAFPSCGITIIQNNGTAAGQTVPHVHVHVIPRRFDRTGSGGLKQHGNNMAASKESLEENAQKIRAALGY